MRRYTVRTFLLIMLLCGVIWATSLPAHAAVGLNNFRITQYTIHYRLGRDSDQHATLDTTETIKARFDILNRNHGIERVIPTNYDGHPTELVVQSIVDETGTSRQYTIRNSGDNRIIRIGDPNKYVSGLQTYRINYTQTDVTKYFKDTNDDEFYWDTNGTQWAVPIDNLSVNLTVTGQLAAEQNGSRSCYLGASEATDHCALSATAGGFSTTATNLQPGKNLTLAIGFKPDTFKAYTPSLNDRITAIRKIVKVVSFVAAILVGIGLALGYFSISNRRRQRTIIVPEYVPPTDTSVTVAASIYNRKQAAFSAQLIDFAVRHYIKIYQTRQKRFFRPAEYELEITGDISQLHPEEQELFLDLFPSTSPGSRLNLRELRKNATMIYLKTKDNAKKLDDSIRGVYGLRAKDPAASRRFKQAGIALVIIGCLTLSLPLFIAAILAFILAATLYPLTDKGMALYHYLEGLKLYITTAEKDRLQMLQSPDGALKLPAPIDTNDQRQLVQLYERVLPYAVLFGQQRQWNSQLGRYYQNLDQQPDWYSGSNSVQGAYNASVFSSLMSDFTTATSSAGSYSASTGASGGGGSSGGGGGGGGGGGW